MENIRAKFNQNISELQKEILTRSYNDNYIYDYQGKVVNNNDPEKLGRCTIRVYNIFSEAIPDSDLPWAISDQSLIDGQFIIPPVGAIVNVRFDRGDVYCPIYTSKVLDRNNLPSQRLTNYPDTMVVFQTALGDYFTVDRSNSKIIINNSVGSDGTFTIDSKETTLKVGTSEIQIAKDKTITLKNDKSQIVMNGVTGAVSISSELSVTVNASLVKIIKNNSGVVAPNPTGGPFCAIPVCPITGMPHQGNTATNS